MANNLKTGEEVRMIDCLEAEENKDKVWITRSEPWEVCGSMVVLLEGKRGGFDVECLERVKT